MKKINCTIMFLDICGSTQLYEQLGDEGAKIQIEKCLSRLSEIVIAHNGGGIRTIGDEIMCRFNSPDDALEAARVAQFDTSSMPTPQDVHLSIRAGLHHGEVILGDNDIFGDAVNVAARMADIAKAGQIITTSDTVSRLSNELVDLVRQIDLTRVKGKRDKIAVYEFLWNQRDDLTKASITLLSRIENNIGILKLTYGNQVCELQSEHGAIIIGRDEGCDLFVDKSLASRKHSHFQLRRNKFIMTDQSINGTYVDAGNGREVYLLREELVLHGNGKLSLGKPVAECATTEIIYFEC
jgi:adenylate cyclase